MRRKKKGEGRGKKERKKIGVPSRVQALQRRLQKTQSTDGRDRSSDKSYSSNEGELGEGVEPPAFRKRRDGDRGLRNFCSDLLSRAGRFQFHLGRRIQRKGSRIKFFRKKSFVGKGTRGKRFGGEARNGDADGKVVVRNLS